MSALTKNIFRNFAAPVALGLGAAASVFAPAAGFAQERPVAANTNVQATPVSFQTFDDRSRSADFVRTGAAVASRDKIAIIVWGGSVDLQRQAFAAAQDLRDQGVPLAFIVGPSRLPYDNVVVIDIYGKGVPVSDLTVGTERIAELRPTLNAQGIQAYGRMFPRELAALAIR